jgi:hypothetical protein
MKTKFLIAASLLAVAAPGHAVEVVWADWQSVNGNTVTGTMATDTPISITYTNTGGFGFVQTGSGTNFWNPGTPYTSGAVTNAPPAAELIALSGKGSSTITFGQPVHGLYFAIISWNGNNATFDQPFEIISQGCGFWGCGTITLGPGNTFLSTGEPHGVIYFPGTFSSLTFTDTNDEFWHGITVGVERLATPEEIAGVPEPSSWAMMIAGLGAAGFAMRRRKRTQVSFA